MRCRDGWEMGMLHLNAQIELHFNPDFDIDLFEEEGHADDDREAKH